MDLMKYGFLSIVTVFANLFLCMIPYAHTADMSINGFIDRRGVLGLDDYLRLIHDVRENAFPIKIITVSDAHCPEDVGWKIPELNRLIAEA